MRTHLLWFLLVPAAFGQQPQSLFRATVPAVDIDAQVRRGGGTIEGLAKGDFIVREDGRSQAVDYFAYGSKPLDLLLLIDTNCWLSYRVTELADAVKATLTLLNPDDRVAVMEYGSEARTVEDFTPEFDRVADRMSREIRIEAFHSGAYTNTNAAIRDAADYLRARSRKDARPAILMFTFNHGWRHVRNRTVLSALWEADAVLDAVIMAPWKFDHFATLPFEANVKQLAGQTGGEYVRRSGAVDVRTLAAFLERIRVCYQMQYRAPAGPAGKAREIRVELAPAAKQKYPHAVVQARRGYVPAQAIASPLP